MGEPNLPTASEANDPQTAEQVLKSVTQDLKALQQDLVSQLSQDVGRLQTERSRLINEIEKLQAQQQMLQSEHQVLLTQQQLAQQRAWAKQLAQTLAGHLYSMLAQRLSQPPGFDAALSPTNLPAAPSPGSISNADRAILALDETLNHALNSLQSDLSTYETSLMQQLNRMQSMERQGEALLEALVYRLSQQLQVEVSHPADHPTNQAAAAESLSSSPSSDVEPSPRPGLKQPAFPGQLPTDEASTSDGSAKTALGSQSDRPTPLMQPTMQPTRHSVRSYVSSSAMDQHPWLAILGMLLGSFLVIAGVVLGGKLITWILQRFTVGATTSTPWLLPTLLGLIAAGLAYLLWRQLLCHRGLKQPLAPKAKCHPWCASSL